MKAAFPPAKHATWCPGRRAILAAALGLALPRAARADGGSQIVETATDSPALGRPLAYCVYLPPGYSPARGPYRVLYLLHGTRGGALDWSRNGAVQATTDALIGAGAIRPPIIVMPDGANSWYVDSGAVGGPGDYARAIDTDLVATIDRDYATDARRPGRAIAGLSMGGYGALRLALARPDRYGAVAAVSPALWMRVAADTVPDERYERVFQGSFGRPFDPQRFVAANPQTLLAAALRSHDVPPVYLSAGRDDYPAIVADTEAFHRALHEAGVPSELHIVDGRHDWGLWSRELGPILRFVDAALGTRAAAAP